jgi:hypothetical protein
MENDTYTHLKRCNNCNNWMHENYFDSHFCVGRAVIKKVEKSMVEAVQKHMADTIIDSHVLI